MTKLDSRKYAALVLVISALGFLIAVGTFRGEFAFAAGNDNDNGNDDHSTIHGNKADPQGSDAACTGNPHDFSQPTGNPHDFSEGNDTGNPHECFEFAVPESPVGMIALLSSSFAALGGYFYFKH